jgi:hypothetical protein
MLKILRISLVTRLIIGAAATGIFFQGTVEAVANSWTNGGGGKWETSTNWSSGSAPSSTDAGDVITNNGTKTVTIDATTAGISSVMTVNILDLTGNLAFPGSHVNTLHLSSAGARTFIVTDTLSPGARSALTIDNSSVQVGGAVNGTFLDDGNVTLNSGSLLLVGNFIEDGSLEGSGDGTAVIGNLGFGQLIINGGSLAFGNADAYMGMTTGSQGTLSQSSGVSEFDDLYVGVGTNATGTVILSGGTLLGGIGLGEQATATGTLWLTGGQLGYNFQDGGGVGVGDFGIGQMTMSNGTVTTAEITLGNSTGAQGTLTMVGGTLEAGGLFVAYGGTGTVWVTGGNLIAGDVYLGQIGVGQMTVSSGTFSITNDEQDGALTIDNGTFTQAGGSSAMVLLEIDHGTVWVTGGQLNATLPGDPLFTGEIGIAVGDTAGGQMVVSNGTMMASSMSVGDVAESLGTLTVAGGISSVFSNLTIGFGCGSTGTGTVIITGGSLFVTNTAHNAVLDFESGTLTLSGGTLVADIFVKTNPCAFFQQTGGTLVVGGVTNPFSPPFQITSIVRTNASDLLITWNTTGSSDIVQVSVGTGASGSYATNGFTDVTNIVVTTATTNFWDVGAATNRPARYYRIRSPQ